jgi:hypothetical protein
MYLCMTPIPYKMALTQLLFFMAYLYGGDIVTKEETRIYQETSIHLSQTLKPGLFWLFS